MKTALKPLEIRDAKLSIPIIQGGMGVAVSTDALASAVSREGGLGVIASVGLGEGIGEPDAVSSYVESNKRALRKLIERARQATTEPLGVNVMMALTDWQDLASTASEEGIDFLIVSAGLPLHLPEYVDRERTKLIPKISSSRAAGLICKKWSRTYGIVPDALIVEGPRSGGHQAFSREQLGNIDDFSLEKTIPTVKEIVGPFEERHGESIPIIAAGGIYDGRDIAGMINLGADGVLMGSRFVCTEECDVADGFKEAYINAKEEDIGLIMSPLGMLARVVKNDFYRRIVRDGGRMPFRCMYRCLAPCDPGKSHFCIADALVAARRGIMEDSLILCSTTTPRIDRILPVRKLLHDLIDDTRRHLR